MQAAHDFRPLAGLAKQLAACQAAADPLRGQMSERQAALLDRMEPRRKYKFVELHALAGNPKQDQTRNDIARLMMIGALRTERVYHANATATYWRK